MSNVRGRATSPSTATVHGRGCRLPGVPGGIGLVRAELVEVVVGRGVLEAVCFLVGAGGAPGNFG